MKVQAEDVERRVASARARIAKIKKTLPDMAEVKRAKTLFNLHNRQRRLAILEQRRSRLVQRVAATDPGTCFGTRKLFRAQFELEANDYASHAEWLASWRAARSGEVYLIGSKDETAGNQSCQAALEDDGTISLTIRLPETLGLGKRITLTGLRFPYGGDSLAEVLARPVEQRAALTWRFVRDEKGWRAFVSLEQRFQPVITGHDRGALGVDINAEHVAIAIIDRHGNPVLVRRFDLPSKDSPADRMRAAEGDIAKAIVDLALVHRVPLVLEDLDFRKKKSELEASADRRYARSLSGLAYASMQAAIRSRATRCGVMVSSVNPAYTSMSGRHCWSRRLGVSIHLSAAVAIARRGMSFSERVPARLSLTLRTGFHVTLPAPAGCGRRHVWRSWAAVRRSEKKAALTARQGMRKQPSTARKRGQKRPIDPAVARSLAEDAEFLRSLCSVGPIPAATSSEKLLARRTRTEPTFRQVRSGL